ncbi:MAG: hypothetical protein OHK0015_01660 [Chloroflexi bacterium OHK40]
MAPGSAHSGRSLLAKTETIIRRRSEEFAAKSGSPAATLETVRWTMDELFEEAEDPDYATHDKRRVRDRRVLRDLVALLQSGCPTDPRETT